MKFLPKTLRCNHGPWHAWLQKKKYIYKSENLIKRQEIEIESGKGERKSARKLITIIKFSQTLKYMRLMELHGTLSLRSCIAFFVQKQKASSSTTYTYREREREMFYSSWDWHKMYQHQSSSNCMQSVKIRGKSIAFATYSNHLSLL